MRKKAKLSTKLLAMGLVFLTVALGAIGFTLWVTWELEGGAAAVNEAGRLRMNMLRMVLARQNESPREFAQFERRFEAGLELLRKGDPTRPLFVPWSADTRERYRSINVQWQRIRQEWRQAEAGEGTAAAMARSDAFVQELDGFAQSIELQIMRWTAVLHLFHLFLVALTIGAAVAFVALSYWLVLRPVEQLQQALARVRQGQLGTRLKVEADDEFGQLAAGFNLMAHTLQSSHQDLERKVREQTASVQEQNQRLSALYAVSALAADAASLDELAQGFARQIRQVAGSDASAVRWSDEANRCYVLLASDGLPRSLAEQEHCLDAGACACGPPREQARMRVIPIIPAGGMPLPHCREEGFETVVSIPIELHQRVLGEVTLLYRSTLVMSEEMRELLAAMAHHLASSMESLRASALEREAAVAQERSLIARELHDSIAQSLAFLKIQTQLLRDAVGKGNTEARDRSMAELDVGVRECYADVRELLVHFRTRTKDEDIEAALHATLSKFEHQTGMQTQLAMTGRGAPLPPDIQIQVLHIVQEALSNVRKHASARKVQLLVERHPHWRFEVRDDGQGFDPQEVPPDSLHVGLGIMRERAQRIGARLEIRSRPDGQQGTSVVVELPMADLQEIPTLAEQETA